MRLLILSTVLFLFCTSLYSQTVTYQVDGLRLYLSENGDCFSGPDPRWRARTTTQYTGWSNWNVDADDISGGWHNFSNLNWVNNTTIPSNGVITVQLDAWEEDPFTCDNPCWFCSNGGPNDGSCGGYGTVSTRTITNQAPCTWNVHQGFRNCTDDGVTITWGIEYGYYWEYATVLGGSITGAQTICSGADPSTIGSTNGGTTAWTSYTWESQANCTGLWTPIAGATGASYNPPALTQTTCFRRRVNACGGASQVSNTVTITVHPVPTVSVSPSISTICSGEATNVTLTGTVGGTIFNWTAFSPDPQISNYSGSNGSTIAQTLTNNGSVQGTVTYTITPTANGCFGSAQTATVNVDPIPQGEITGPTALCTGSSDQINFNFLWGTPPYDVVYTDGTSNFNLNDINSGHAVGISPTSTTTYSLVSIIDDAGNGCTRTSGFAGSATVTVNPLPNGSISGNTTICEGDATDITFNFSAGTGSYNVQYSDGSGSTTLTGISDGHVVSVSPTSTTTYTITQITDANGCVRTSGFGAAATVTVNEMPNGTMSVVSPICQGDATTLTFTFTAGTGPYNISYTDGINTYSESGISSGATASHTPPTTVTYTYTSIEDANGCFRTVSFAGNAQVTVNPLPNVSFTGLASDYCVEDPAITLTGNQAPGGTFAGPGITDGLNGTASFDPMGASVGVHSITYTFTDINGCTNTATESVNVDEEPTANAGATADECDLDHTFAATASVGTGTWTLDNGPGAAFFSNANSPTSSVQVTAYGTYDFQWEEVNGQCSDASIVTINFYEMPTVDLGADRDECQTTFTLDQTTSIPVTTYSWTQVSGPATALIVTPAGATTDIVTTGALGVYVFQCEVTLNGCTSSDQISITQIPQPVANAGAGGNECDLNFNLGATASVGVGAWTQTGGPGFASFAPSPADTSATVTVSQYGNYTFTWTETNLDCSSSQSVTVNFYQQPVADAGSGGNECDLDFTFSANPSVGNGMWTQVSGPGTSTFVDATNPATTVSVDMVGAYDYQWQEVNGTCSDSATITVNYFEQPVADPGTGGNECDLSFQLDATESVGIGTWTYSGPGTATFTPNANDPDALVDVSAYGVYIFTWTEDNFGCMDSGNITVNFNQQTTADAGQGGDECDLTFVFNATPSIGAGSWTSSGPGNAFFINPNSPTATVTVDTYGSYLFTWTEVNGTCVASDQVTVNFWEQPVADAGVGGDECNLNFEFSAALSSGTGTWVQTAGPGTTSFILSSDPTTIATVSTYGTYDFTWTEVNGTCSDAATVTVNFYELPVADAGVGGDECDLDFVFNGATSVGNGSWAYTGPGTATFTDITDPATDVSVTAYGSYDFTWSEVNGSCSSAATITVNFYDQPVADAGLGGDECDLDFLLNATPSVGVGAWSMTSGPGVATFGNSASPTATVTVDTYGTYEFTWTETNGTCTDFETVTVNFYQQPVADAGLGGDECDLNFVLAANASVGNGTWTYVGPGTATFGSANAASTTVDVSVSGAYTFTWTEVNGVCSDSDDIIVNFWDQPLAIAGQGGNECDLDFVFSAIPSFGTGTWTYTGPGTALFSNVNSATSSVTVDTYGSFTFTWTEVNGICTDNASITVDFHEQPLSNPGPGIDQCDLDYTFGATPSVGTGTWTYNGPGIATFTPNANDAGATVTVDTYGNYNFTWTEDNNGCISAAVINMNFHQPPTVSFTGLNGPYCIDDTNPVSLVGTPAGGTFSGLGVSGNQFVPSVAGVGTIFITYTYTDVNGCVNDDVQSVDVNGLPVVSFTGLGLEYCADDATVNTLIGSPAGGTFSGPGITGNDFVAVDAGSGTHTLTYTYSDVFGCVNTESQTVTVHDLPVVSFTGLNPEYCFDGALAQLTGSPAGGTFAGPGLVGSQFSPAIAGVGVHDVSYTYTDANGCTNIDVQSVEVHALPVASINPSGTVAICDGDVLTLDAGPGFATYDWTGLGSNQTLNVTTAGSYSVTVTTTAGCVATSSATTVTVNPLPIVDLGNDTTICVGGNVTLDAGNPGASYNWSTFETTQTITVSSTDNYSVIVTDGNNCSAIDDITVQVQGAITPIIVAQGPSSFCSGGSVVLDAGPGYSNYLWSTSETSQTITVTQSGVYDVLVTDPFGCSGPADPFLVTVFPLPNAVIVPDGPTSICDGDSVTLCASNTFANYQWGPSGETTNCITVSQSGTYNVTVIDPNNNCSNVSSDMVVEVHIPQVPTITWNGPLEFCHGENVVLDAGVGFSSYLWTSGSTNQSITVTQTGDYGVTVIDENNCIDSSLLATPIHVEVWNPDPITFQQGDSVLVTNGPFTQYQWYLNGNPVPGATGPVHYPTVSGNYTLQVWDENGCSGTAPNIEFTFTGIADGQQLYDVRIHPNPNSGQFIAEIDLGTRRDVTLELTDLLGKKVMQPEFVRSVSSVRRSFDIDHLGNGIYFLHLTTDEGRMAIRIIKD